MTTYHVFDTYTMRPVGQLDINGEHIDAILAAKRKYRQVAPAVMTDRDLKAENERRERFNEMKRLGWV